VSTSDKTSLESRISDTARRLRLIQVDFADDSQQTRMEYLREEIERALKTVLPEQRKAFLEGLMDRFPTGYLDALLNGKPLQIQEGPEVDAEPVKDPEIAVWRLLEMAATLSAEQKESVGNRLQEAGLIPRPAAQACSEELTGDLRKKLQLGDAAEVKAERLAALVSLLTDFVLKLEPLVWNTWRTLAPRSGLRPPATLQKTLAQLLCDDSQESPQKAEHDLKMLQRLVAAIVTAVGGVGKQFGKRHLARFSPAEISALVRMEHGSVFVSHEVKCWRKYFELAETLTEDSIEMELRKALADYAESLIKGLDR
jgi:hypothetical protein